MKSTQVSAEKISKKLGVPLHHQLFLVLRDQILRGLYEPGAQIPPEDQLGELFKVSRITVRRAVSDLHAQGLLVKRHGHGTFVREDLPAARPAPTLGFIELFRKQAQDTLAKVLSITTEQPPALITLNLQLEPSEKAVHVVRLRTAKGTPVMVIDAWLPEETGGSFTAANLREKAMHDILLEQGAKFGRVVQEITAVPAVPELANQLQAEVGSPLLRITRLLYDVGRKPLLHTTIFVSPDRSRVLADIPIGSMNTFSAGQIAHDAHNGHWT